MWFGVRKCHAFWIKTWEACLENNMAAELMELGIAGTCLTKHGFVGDAWNAGL